MDLAFWRAALDAAVASRSQASPSKAFDGLVALTMCGSSWQEPSPCGVTGSGLGLLQEMVARLESW